MAKLYRKCAGVLTPAEVDAARPSHIAALFGFDELDAAEGEEHVAPRSVEAVPAPPRDPNLDRSLTRTERLRRLGVLEQPEAKNQEELKKLLDAGTDEPEEVTK